MTDRIERARFIPMIANRLQLQDVYAALERDDREAALLMLDNALNGKPGLVIVPREPTEAMTKAYLEAQQASVMESDAQFGVSSPAKNFRAGYRAMIAAALKEQGNDTR